MKKIYTAIFFLILGFSSQAQFFKEWNRPVNNMWNFPYQNMVTDSLGNVYVFRSIQRVPYYLGSYAVLEKFNPDGLQAWTLSFPSTGSNTTGTCRYFPRWVTIDSRSDLILTVKDDVTGIVWLMKINIQGYILWQVPLSSDYSLVTIDSSDAIYLQNFNSHLILKFDPNGNLIHTQGTNGSPSALYFINNSIYFGESSGLTLYLHKIDSAQNYTTLFYLSPQVPFSDDYRLINVGNNEFYIWHANDGGPPEHFEVRNLTGGLTLTFPIRNNPDNYYVNRDPDGNLWAYLSYNSLPAQIQVFKYDSLNNFIFSQIFQAPDISYIYAAQSGTIINSELYIPVGWVKDSVHQMAGILKVDSSGNMHVEGEAEYLLYYDSCRYDIIPTATTFGFDRSTNSNYIVTTWVGQHCSVNEFFFQLAKYSCNGYSYSGKVFDDLNSNGSYDNLSEFGLANQKITVFPDSACYYSNSQGNYLITLDSSSARTFQFNMPSGGGLTTDSLSYTVTPGSSDSCCYDFGLTEITVTHNILSDLTASNARCDQDVVVWLTVTNNSLTPENVGVVLTLDSLTPFLTSTVPFASLNGSRISWSPDTIFPLQQFQVAVTLHSPGISHLGETAHYHLDILDASASNLISSSDASSLVTCSYDPNDKQVTPEGIGAEHETLPSEELTYTIRFQNTGNDTAYDVTLLDTLDGHLDLRTFRIHSYSHPVEVKLKENGVLTCLFKQVMLPDSGTDFNGSQGFFKYSIRAKNHIPLPSRVKNRAYIYFDYNLPVITNEVQNTLTSQLLSATAPSFTNEIKIYPNPVKDYLTVSSEVLQPGKITLSILDIQGKSILIIPVQHFPSAIDCRFLSKGIYFLRVETESGSDYFRFIKMQ